MSCRVDSLTGEAMRAAIPALARLRVAVFRDWPYLYDGTLDYESSYLQTVRGVRRTQSCRGVRRRQDRRRRHRRAARRPRRGLRQGVRGRRPSISSRIFYCGESVLLPAYRGQGVGHAFFDGREAHARALGRFTHITFCGVVRPDDHPLKPAGYRPLDAFWMKRGYRKADGLTTTYAWKDIDQAGETAEGDAVLAEGAVT